MKALAPLIRWQRWQLDQQRRVLADAERGLQQLDDALVALADQVRTEQETARTDAQVAANYGAFAAWATDRDRALRQLRSQAEATVAAARDVLAELFAELKRYEIAAQQQALAAALAATRAETAELDEIAAVRFQRQEDEAL